MSAWSCRSIDGKAAHKIVPPRPRIPCWKGHGADSEEKQELASDIDIAVVDSLKVLDPKRPIREERTYIQHEPPGPNPAREHRSIQPIIIGRKPPEILKSLSGKLAEFRSRKGTQ